MLKTNKLYLQIALFLVVFLIAFLPRVISLGELITIDEPTWFIRSDNFGKAIKNLEFEKTLQPPDGGLTHPGVTTMWLGYAGLSLTRFATDNPKPNVSEKYFYTRLPNVVTITFLIAISSVLLLELFGLGVALVASLLIATNPILIAFSKVLQMDALLTSFILVSILTFLVYIKNKSFIFLLLSGVLGGLAILTKVPAILLLPFFFLVILISRKSWRLSFKEITLWSVAAVVTMILLWPALWVIPFKALDALVGTFIKGGSETHEAPIYALNLWYYPKKIFFFGQPVTLALFSVTLVFSALSFFKKGFFKKNLNLVVLTLFVVIFTSLMTLGAKKGERYILPIYPIIDISVTIFALYITRVIFKIKPILGNLFLVVFIGLILLQSFFAIRTHPYYLAYYNPIANTANAKLGHGEGLEKAARYLNDKEDVKSLVVASWYNVIFGTYFNGATTHIKKHKDPEIDYVIIYRGMFDRGEDSWVTGILNEYYPGKVPEKTIVINGLEYIWIYQVEKKEKIVN